MEEIFHLLKLSIVIDYLIIGAILYFIFSTLKGTRAAKIVFWLITLYFFKTVSLKLELHNTSKLLSFLFDNLIILILIIFQEEIRHLITRINRKWSETFGKTDKSEFSSLEKIVNAASKLAKEKVGALIVLQGEMDLQDHVSGGTILNCDISEEIILTIFENHSALHDGALVIQDNKIFSAASVLPLSKNKNIDFRLGTRHRAAIGVTEDLDCLALIVSEETGQIRISEKGKIIELNEEELKYKIINFYRTRDSNINQLTKILNKVSAVVQKVQKKLNKNK